MSHCQYNEFEKGGQYANPSNLLLDQHICKICLNNNQNLSRLASPKVATAFFEPFQRSDEHGWYQKQSSHPIYPKSY